MLPAAIDGNTPLPALIAHAARVLAGARNSAEVLEARDIAGIAYDQAKRAARLAKAKHASDDLISKAHHLQADALMIEAGAKRRLADEYDAAQERGEAAKAGDNQHNREVVPSGNDLGLSRKDIHEARVIRDAERADPGVVRRTVDEAIAARVEPSKAKVKRAARKAAGKKTKKRKNKAAASYAPESEHDRDLKMLRNVWGAACASAQQAFLRELAQTS